MGKTTGAGTLAAALVLWVSCAVAPAGMETDANPPPIENTDWVLVALGGRKLAPPQGRASTLRLASEGRKAAGNAGCNRFGGTYTLEGTGLRFSPLVSTKMFCEGAMEREHAFLGALSATTSYRIEGGDLLLLGADGALARLRSGSEKSPDRRW
jgi:heat shock protein HslJ